MNPEKGIKALDQEGMYLREGVFESLDDIREPLIAVIVWVLVPQLRGDGCNGQKGHALEQHNLFRVGRIGQSRQVPFNHLEIGNEAVHDVPPGFIQRLVPDTGAVGPNLSPEALTPLPDRFRLILQDSFPMLGLDQVHLMYQREDVSMRRKLLQGLDDRVVGVKISKVLPIPTVKLAGLDIEDVDEYSDLGEHIGFLRRQVVLREGILA